MVNLTQQRWQMCMRTGSHREQAKGMYNFRHDCYDVGCVLKRSCFACPHRGHPYRPPRRDEVVTSRLEIVERAVHNMVCGPVASPYSDVALLLQRAAGLQGLIDAAKGFCTQVGMCMSAQKTFVMVFWCDARTVCVDLWWPAHAVR